MTEQLWLFELDAPGKPSRFWSGVEWIDSALEAVRFPDLEAARSYHDERFTGDTAVKIRGHTFGCGATLPTNINVSETQPHANKYVTSTAESSQSATDASAISDREHAKAFAAEMVKLGTVHRSHSLSREQWHKEPEDALWVSAVVYLDKLGLIERNPDDREQVRPRPVSPEGTPSK
jgi:hypothetical protein